jgi:para-aminobenzoate synthetase
MFSLPESHRMKTLLLDNYDSFSHILFQYLWEVNGEEPLFVRNDEWTLDRIRAERFDNIVISPGPGHPGNARDFGVCGEVLRADLGKPILGVCLGLQGLGLSAGAAVGPAPVVRHGKPSRIRHDGRGLFAGLPQGFEAVRYHSLALDPASLVADIEVTATAEDDGQIMGARLSGRPVFGVQFHPESIGTEHGKALLANFRDMTAEALRMETGAAPAVAPDPAARPRPAAPMELEAIALPWRDPEAAFAAWFRDAAAAFWLDSLSEPVPGEPRMTYMGSGTAVLEARGGRCRAFRTDGPGETAGGPDPFAFLDAELRSGVPCMLPKALGFPGSFRGGLVGAFGYGLKRWTGGGGPRDHADPDLPDALFLRPDRMLAFDPATRRAWAFLPCGPQGPSDAARAWLASLAGAWESLPGEPEAVPVPAPASASPFRLPWIASASRETYLESIRSLQEAIRRGETYEACLTQELRVRCDADPFAAYRVLRRSNPAPYAAFLRLPGADLLCASPERFLKLDAAGNLECRPIKGTRPRGRDAASDAALRDDLAGNPKDRSENLMIVDLMRNDFGKVCAPGSVAVPDAMRVEPHPSVWQLVSTVTGRLMPGRGPLDAVRACFPAGSMTGAPKKRTMELLEAAERRPRGLFSGALGYLGWDGAMDLGMIIRTLVRVEGEYRIGCGGAILDESDPEAEYAEALLKAAAPMRALEWAAGMENAPQ